MTENWIIDASPLILLGKAGQLDWLPQMVFGIPMRGSLSFVALAKKRGLVTACRPVFQQLLAAGLYVSPDLVEQVALSAGE